jgi:hypothetical protein
MEDSLKAQVSLLALPALQQFQLHSDPRQQKAPFGSLAPERTRFLIHAEY